MSSNLLALEVETLLKFATERLVDMDGVPFLIFARQVGTSGLIICPLNERFNDKEAIRAILQSALDMLDSEMTFSVRP